MLETDTPWTWAKRTYQFDGTTYTEWRGSHPYHTAVVTDFANSGRWQARMAHASGDQYSPYYRTPASAKAWCERYGRPRKRGKRAR